MSIFLINLICLLISGLPCVISFGIISEKYWLEEPEKVTNKRYLTSLYICASLFIVSVFIGVGFNTEGERVYVQKYIAQKETIEASLESEELSGFERIELVKQATELNGEFAERKAYFNLWHFVVYDNTIYDGVELIDLSVGEKVNG